MADPQEPGREDSPRVRATRPLVPDHPNAIRTRVVLKLTPAHDAVLAILDWWLVEMMADAALVAALLAMPEADAAWLLDELAETGCVASATGPPLAVAPRE